MSDLRRILARTDDLRQLSKEQQEEYCLRMCERYGLDPLDRPFRLSNLNGKLTLYLEKQGADQLRTLHKISVYPIEHEVYTELGVVVVWGKGVTPEGREEFDVGSAPIKGSNPKEVADAFKKAVSSLKRRLTLSLIGAPSEEPDEEPEENLEGRDDQPDQKPEPRTRTPKSEGKPTPGALLHAELKRKLSDPTRKVDEETLVRIGRTIIQKKESVESALEWVKQSSPQQIWELADSDADDLLSEIERHG